MSEQEKAVKTRQTATEAVKEWQMRSHTKEELEFSPNRVHQGFLGGWNAALASAVPGGRFEVGDKVEVRFSTQYPFEPATICAVIDGQERTVSYIDEPVSYDCLRPRPQTVDLTVEEKVKACVEFVHGQDQSQSSLIIAWVDVANALANGKTIDELCQDYGVKTTREVS